MKMYKKTIVIPTYGRWDLTGNLLRQLKEHEANNINEIVVVDDFPDNMQTKEGVDSFAEYLPVSLLSLEENMGFTLASNRGLQLVTDTLAERKVVFLISNDVQILGKFIDQAVEILTSPRRSFVGNRHISFDTGWNTFDGKTFDYLEGYFLACTADGWRDLGYFDPNYAPYDYEDIDISTTAKVKGYKLVSLNSPVIRHNNGGTLGFSPKREAITNRNKEYFRRKWMK